MDRGVFRLGVAALALVAAAPVAAEDLVLPGADEAFKWTGGVGVVALRADEIVYHDAASSDEISHLIWTSTAPMLTGGFDVALPDGWTLAASADVAIGGDSYMEDFDWIDYDGTGGPFVLDYSADNWTHRSQHDATDLEHYFSGSLMLGRDLALREGFKINLNGGFKYTDVQWTANGGSFVYSTAGFRDDVYEWPDDVKGVTYRQSFPALITGIDAEVTEGAWTFGGSAHAGFTLYGIGDDHHWQGLEPKNFIDRMGPAPVLSVGGSATYAMADNLDLFVAGSAEAILPVRGDVEITRLSDGADLGTVEDVIADGLIAAKLSGGVKGSF